MRLNLPPDEYFKQLTKVPTSGGIIFTNTKGEFLTLRQTYKDDYEIPGGMTEAGETPRQAAIRETQEELGISIQKVKLFCVDCATDKPFDRLLFVFNGGMLSDQQIADIKIDKDEIVSFEFMPYEKWITVLSPRIGKRIKNSFEFFDKEGCAYLENGEKI